MLLLEHHELALALLAHHVHLEHVVAADLALALFVRLHQVLHRAERCVQVARAAHATRCRVAAVDGHSSSGSACGRHIVVVNIADRC